MKIRLFLVSCFFLFSHFLRSSQTSGVLINEFQTSNGATIVDEDSEFTDWIELKNASADSINLEGWSLTDTRDETRKWVFPKVTMKAGSHLIIFASGKDKRVANATLHTNFKLSASGEDLGLYRPDGLPATMLLDYPEVETDQSYGVMQGSWVTFRVPTPGKANVDTSMLALPAPVFSHKRGFYDKPFQLIFESAQPNTSIYYTTDGSVPSTSNGKVYTKSIGISKTAIIRAMALTKLTADSLVFTSPVMTHTYLFIDDILTQSNTPSGYPAKWGPYDSIKKTIMVDGVPVSVRDTAIADYEMDPELLAEPAYALKVRESLKELPVISLVTDKNHFFNRVNDPKTGGIYIYTGVYGAVGDGWERPVSFEYFNLPDQVSIQANCGINLRGGASRLPEKMPKHSFKLNFSSEYGPTKLKFPMFDDVKTKEFNALNLRAGFGNTWAHWSSGDRSMAVYVRDMWAKRTQKSMGHLSGSGRYAHLFINGMYWGFYNPNERIDDDYFETYLGGDKTEYDVIGGDGVVVMDGNLTAYNKMQSILGTMKDVDTTVFMQLQGMNPDGSINPEFEPLLDMENFIDYMLLNYYGANGDWDSHNWVCARNRYNPGKGFRFLSWDAEHVIKGVNDNKLSMITNKCPTYMFHQLKKSPLFIKLLSERVQKHCYNEGSLTPSKTVATFNKLIAEIENSLYAESARWGDYRKDVHPWSSAGPLYRKDVQFDALRKSMIDNYFPKRTDVFIGHLRTAGLLSKVDAPIYKVNNLTIEDDSVTNNDLISIVSPKAVGQVYYTTNDTDPLLWSNTGPIAQSPQAVVYNNAIKLNANTSLKARILYMGEWSPLAEIQFKLREAPVGLSEESNLLSLISMSNAPNPFVSQTTFRYSVPFDAQIRLEMYDVSGRLVATVLNTWQTAGNYDLNYDGASLPRGIYVCKFVVQGKYNHQSVLRVSKL